MAAPGRHVGHCLQKNGQFLLNNIERLWFCRSFHWSRVLQQHAAEAHTDSSESVVIPKKKTWSSTAVLEALAATVNRDPTAHPHQFQDDSYLSPRTSSEFALFSLSLESGRAAAKYFVNSNPKLFTKDFAQPHIPCLMPQSVSLVLEEVSEAALRERLSLRRVSAAVDMYDQLLQSGQTVSMETTHDLLDLICLYCDRDPAAEGTADPEDSEEGEAQGRKRKGRFRKAAQLLKYTWRENNNAERIFNLIPERDTRCYSALIRGMVKHGAFSRAFHFYTDMLNNRVTGDVHIFNALISAAPEVREKYQDRWDLVVELLNEMKQQKVCPTLQTFNAALRALRRCGFLSKTLALHTLSEMKALGIEPSLASYDHVLAAFFRAGATTPNNIDIFREVLSVMEGTSFSCQDPDDVYFFCSAMRICLDNKDLELGYKVQALVEFGENWRLLGDPYQQSIYYGRFFNLLCLMEDVDAVLTWYRRLIPSLYYPNPQGMKDLLQALDTDSRLELLPSVWKDIRSLGHDNKLDLVEELLGLMARDKHSSEVQQQFSECALEVKSVFDGDRVRSLDWTSAALNHVTVLLLRAQHTAQAWETLQLFKTKNRVPTVELMEEFLSWCVVSGSCDKAVDLVQTSVSFCLPCTSKLTQRALRDLPLTEDQRSVLSELESAAESSV
ncbi:unnamed protein product [Knipowitschia caucasica]|uniref:Small ribosomal subunit protein mS39 n=1 Tax=Knipowitschia caucasica TaxID=637954 RepID=A0AAV2MMW7_KNICA